MKRITKTKLVSMASLVTAAGFLGFIGLRGFSCASAKESDPHSFANFRDVAVTHADLKLSVDFEKRILRGSVRLSLINKTDSRKIILDMNGLKISSITRTNTADGTEVAAPFVIGNESAIKTGQPLEVEIEPTTQFITIQYETSPGAEAVQWLEPAQTAGKKYPFLFTQSQSIYARTWIPLQDTPSVRMTYSAEVKVPTPLMAVMSASNPQVASKDGVYHFTMPQAIPSYLMALSVGDLKFMPIGKRTGVYAEPSLVEKAHYELVDAEKMVEKAEEFYGPYPWERYDMIVLPPGFPFGGMENPRLTFLTPTFITGDRSLVNLIAHELSHSWTGNLVTNTNANHFWLNEGFTVYGERRIIELLYGKDLSELQAQVGLSEVKETVTEFLKDGKPEFTKLRQRLDGIHPDAAYSDVPYEKGYLFLRSIADTVGREKFDAFFLAYIEKFKFKSVDTYDFMAFLGENLIQGDGTLRRRLQIDTWLNAPGLPLAPQRIPSVLLDRIERLAKEFLDHHVVSTAMAIELKEFSTFEWIQWMKQVEPSLTLTDVATLEKAFSFTTSTNAEILTPWLVATIKLGYRPAIIRAGEFLKSMGRGKFVKPTFKAILDSGDITLAKQYFEAAKGTYHPVMVKAVSDMIAARDATCNDHLNSAK